MKKRVKTWSVILAILMAALIVVSCQSQVTDTQSSEAATTESVQETAEQSEADAGELSADLVMWVQSRGTELEDIYDRCIAEFNEQYPDINVTVEYISSGDMQAKTQAAIMAGTTPDIVEDFIGRAGTYMNADLLVPMDDIFTADYQSQFYEGVITQGIKDGSVYIFPERVDYYLMNVNKTLFDEAGATDLLPLEGERTWTREEFEEAVAAVSKDGVYGIGLWAANEQSDINTKILIEGGMETSMYSDDFQTIEYDSPAAIEGLTWLCSLIDNGYAMPDSANLTDDEVWMLYAQKKVAILPTTAEPFSWIPAQIEDGVATEPFEIVAVQFPTAEGDNSKTAAPMSGFGIFKNDNDSNQIAAAKEFLKFISEKGYSRELVELFGSFPALIADSDMYSDNEELDWIANTLGNYVYDAGYASNGFADVRLALYPEVQAAYAGIKTPEQAMIDFTAAGDEILAQANAQ